MSAVKTRTWKFEPLDPKIDRTELDAGSLRLSHDDLLKLYRAMRMSRTFELRLASLYRQGRVVGAVYLGMGHEAIATGVVKSGGSLHQLPPGQRWIHGDRDRIRRQRVRTRHGRGRGVCREASLPETRDRDRKTLRPLTLMTLMTSMTYRPTSPASDIP